MLINCVMQAAPSSRPEAREDMAGPPGDASADVFPQASKEFKREEDKRRTIRR